MREWRDRISDTDLLKGPGTAVGRIWVRKTRHETIPQQSKREGERIPSQEGAHRRLAEVRKQSGDRRRQTPLNCQAERKGALEQLRKKSHGQRPQKTLHRNAIEVPIRLGGMYNIGRLKSIRKNSIQGGP